MNTTFQLLEEQDLAQIIGGNLAKITPGGGPGAPYGTPGIYMGWGNSGGNGAWGWVGQLTPAFSKKRP